MATPTSSCQADVVPTIICPNCRAENQPAGLSALNCQSCQETIDPRELGVSAKAFIKRQQKLRRKSGAPLEQEEADELFEWVFDLPPGETPSEGDAEASRKRLNGLLAGPSRLRAAVARRERPEVLYSDSVVQVRDDGIVLRQYYWPIGRKRIPYTEIRSFTVRPLRAWHGQYRVHGIDHRGRWYSRDRHRGEKERAIDLTIGRLIHPVLTPDDIDVVLRILERQVTNDQG